jgi:hypothetical protein
MVKVEKTKDQEQQDGLKMHAGMDETSAILYLRRISLTQGSKMPKDYRS